MTCRFISKLCFNLLKMISSSVFQIIVDNNRPPGLTHPLLVENFAWVDKQLCKIYNNRYTLITSDFDEYETSYLLNENWDWVDERLEAMYNLKEDDPQILCPLPITWSYPRYGDILECIEEDGESVESYIGYHRNRSESDISEYKVETCCQSSIPINYISSLTNSFCNLDCEHYDEAATDTTLDNDSVSSLGWESVYMDRYPTTNIVPYDDDCEHRFVNCPTPMDSINDEVHIVSDDDNSVY